MSLVAINLPCPTANGTGAAQSVATLGVDKTVIIGGVFNPSDASVIIEASGSAAGENFCQVAVVRAPKAVQLPVIARRMRVTVTGLKVNSTFAPTVDIAGESATPTFATITPPAGNGVGASVDVSALPDIRTLFVTGTFSGAVIFEGSQDNTNFVEISSSVVSPRCIGAVQPVKYLRVRRTGVNAAAPGTPVVEICAVAQDGGGGSVSFPLNATAGTVGAPSIYFGDPNTGLYAPAAGELAITSNGTLIAKFSDTQGIVAPSDATGTLGIVWSADALSGFTNEAVGLMTVYVDGYSPMSWEKAGATGQTLINIGSLTLPAIAFGNNKDTGFFSITSGDLDFATDGVQNARMTAGGGNPQLLMPAGGLSGNPKYSFIGNTNTGMFQNATDSIAFSAGGTTAFQVQLSGGNLQTLHPDGSAAATPGVAFLNDLNTGVRRSAADTMHLVTGGADRLSIDATVSAGNTALLVSVAGAAPTRVSVGANDSGGLGFRYLRVPN